MAEYYNIYNYENFEPLYIATLVAGLRGSSRLKMELSGIKYTEQEIIQAKICDSLSLLVWAKTKDAERGVNKPQMLVNTMLELEEQKEFQHDVFNSKEEFLEARKRALNR